jgi:dihydroorotate dehydrogenase (NAD+) catalytic subunit
MLAGASAVQVGTGNFVDPNCAQAIVDGLVAFARENKLQSVRDFGALLNA